MTDPINTPEPLPTADAKQALITEIRNELKNQNSLKKEVLNELKPSDFKTEFWEVTKHPVILLIIGSIFGGWLSSCYQQREWDRQQVQLSEKQRVEKKIATRDEATDSIIEAYSAAESAVRPFFYENAKTFAMNEKDRAKEWSDASKKWQHARLKLLQKLDLYFTDPEVRKKFVEIIELKNESGNSLFVEVNNAFGSVKTRLLLLNESSKAVEEQSKEYKELKDWIRNNVMAMITQGMAKTKELRDLMQKEIEKEHGREKSFMESLQTLSGLGAATYLPIVYQEISFKF